MKRPGLSHPLRPATLFLAAAVAFSPALRAEDAAPAKPAAPKLSDRDAELIKRYDKDGDGKLSAEELAAAHDQMRMDGTSRPVGPNGAALPPGSPFGAQIYQRLLQTFDRDHDGKLTGQEQIDAVEAIKQRNPDIYQRLIQRADVNNDGKLDESERTAMFDFLAKLPVTRPEAKDGKENKDAAAAARPPLTEAERENLKKFREEYQRRRAERQKQQEAATTNTSSASASASTNTASAPTTSAVPATSETPPATPATDAPKK